MIPMAVSPRVGLLSCVVGLLAVACAHCSTLYLLSLAPFPDDRPGFGSRYGGQGGPGIVPVVQLAIDHINNDSSVLPDYELELLSGDSGCVVTSKSTESIVRKVFSGGLNVFGIVGPICSGAAATTGALIGLEGVSLLQFAIGSSPVLSAPEFSNTIKALGTSRIFVKAFMQLMKDNDWQNVGTLHETDRTFFVTSYLAFRKEILANNYTIPASPEVTRTSIDLMQFKDTQTRIIVVFAAGDFARMIMCMSHQKYFNLQYPAYLFFFPDKFPRYLNSSQNFTLDGRRYICSIEEMAEALQGAVFSATRTQRPKDTAVDLALRSGLTFGEYSKQLGERLGPDEKDEYANVYYDGVWSLALALTQSEKILQEKGYINNLTDYKYGQKTATDIIKQQLLGLNFEGASGRIYFDSETLEAKPAIDFFLAQQNKTTLVLDEPPLGVYIDDRFNITHRELPFEFINDEFPTNFNDAHLGVAILAFIVILLVLVLTTSLHALTFYYRNWKTVKATSPNLNTLIFSGCYLYIVAALAICIISSFSSYLLSVRTVLGVLCSVVSWSTTIAYSLIFGTIGVRTFRIYRIFTGFKHHGLSLYDETLIGFVVLLLVFDVTVNIVWNAVDPWVVVMVTTQQAESVLVHLECHSEHLLVWLSIIVISKLLLTAAVLFFSILTINVSRKEFRQSKNINILTYCLVLPYCVSVFVSFFFSNSSPYVAIFIQGTVFLVSVLLCQFALFLPPLLPILVNKLYQYRTVSLVM